MGSDSNDYNNLGRLLKTTGSNDLFLESQKSGSNYE